MESKEIEKVLLTTLDETKTKLSQMQSDILEDLEKLDEKFKNLLQDQKDKINTYVRQKVEDFVIDLVRSIRPMIQQNLKHPEMCSFIKELIDDLVDEIYPDFEDYFRYKLRLNLIFFFFDYLFLKIIS